MATTTTRPTRTTTPSATSSTTASARDEEETSTRPAKGRHRLLVLAVVAIVLVAAAGYLLFGRGGGDQAPPPPEPGAVLTLDPINVNLADGHYLKVGIALQLTADAPAEVDGARALDIAINQLSGQQMGALLDSTTRSTVKEELLDRIEKAYPEEVMGLYFTEFVMQ